MPNAAGPTAPAAADNHGFAAAFKEFTDANGTLSINELKQVLMRPAEGGSAMSDEDSDVLIRCMLEEGIDVLAGLSLIHI